MEAQYSTLLDGSVTWKSRTIMWIIDWNTSDGLPLENIVLPQKGLGHCPFL